MRIDSLRLQMDTLNRDLARLTGLDPAFLSFQTGEAEQDALFLYGIVGGKDVGKTSLINQLAGSKISLDTDVLDEGTNVAVAYCHREDISPLRKRLASEVDERLTYVPHDREELRSVVLIDFPDFDSRFITHREDVRRLGKHLQGIVWIITPRKYGDHEFMDQLEAVAQSNENYYVVLNKIDQIDGKDDLETIREEISTYLRRECAKRNVPPPEDKRFLIVSAIEPRRYDLSQLQAGLIRVHSPEEITRAKVENLRAEFGKNLERIRSHYALSEKIEEIDQALEHIHDSIYHQFNEKYFDAVRRRIVSLEAMRRRISSSLFAQRVEGWPILRSLFYPLAGIVSVLGGRLAFVEKDPELGRSPRILLRYEGRSASSRIQETRETVEERFPDLHRDLGDMPDFSDLIDREFTKILQEHEEEVTERLGESVTPPGILRRILVYFPLVWFPFLQPFLLHTTEWEGAWFSLASLREFLTVLVSLFGAGSLLQCIVFLLVFYAVCLILLYARGARLVVKEGREEFRNSWYERFLPWMIEVLSRPLREVGSALAEKSSQLDEVETGLETELHRLSTSRLKAGS